MKEKGIQRPVVEKAGGGKGLLEVVKPGEHHTITVEREINLTVGKSSDQGRRHLKPRKCLLALDAQQKEFWPLHHAISKQLTHGTDRSAGILPPSELQRTRRSHSPWKTSKSHKSKMHRLVWDAVDVLVDAVGIELPLILSTSCTCGTLMPGSFHLLDKSDFRFRLIF